MSDRDQRTRVLHRWLRCLTAMAGGGRYSAGQLAGRFGVSRRTIYRDLLELQAALDWASRNPPAQRLVTTSK